MEIFVYSRSGLDAARPHEVAHVVISITSATDDVARLRSNRSCVGVLRLAFETASEQHPESALFSREHAAAIWSFVLEHRSAIERVIVHCDAGTSRSPAVAAALARVLNGDDAEYFGGRYRPNKRVYESMLATKPSAS